MVISVPYFSFKLTQIKFEIGIDEAWYFQRLKKMNNGQSDTFKSSFIKILVFLRYFYPNQCLSNLKTKMIPSLIENDNIFNEDFNMQLNKSSNKIEGIWNDFWNFSDEQDGNVTKLTLNFELKLEMYFKEPAFADIITLNSNIFNCSYLVFDRDHRDHDRDRYIHNQLLQFLMIILFLQ